MRADATLFLFFSFLLSFVLLTITVSAQIDIDMNSISCCKELLATGAPYTTCAAKNLTHTYCQGQVAAYDAAHTQWRSDNFWWLYSPVILKIVFILCLALIGGLVFKFRAKLFKSLNQKKRL